MTRRLWMGSVAGLVGLRGADSPADLERVAVGTAAPDFSLPNGEGEAVRLGSLRGQRTVVVFYRGHW